MSKVPHTKFNPCPVCEGYASLPRGQRIRCHGFTNGKYTYCSREEFRGDQWDRDGLYKHFFMEGYRCHCSFYHLGEDANSRDGYSPIARPIERNNPNFYFTDDSARAAECDSDRKKKAKAKAIWEESETILDSPAEKYLNSRGIYFHLTHGDHMSAEYCNLRYHPSLIHYPSEQKYPALVACIEAPVNEDETWDQQFIGIQVTYLTEDENGEITKADVNPPKKNMGKSKGGAIYLTHLANQLEMPTRLGKIAIVAGVENALSVMQMNPMLATIAVTGDAFIEHVTIPEGAVEIEIHADGDKSGERAAYKAMEKFKMQEYEVRKIIYETDANDHLIQKQYRGNPNYAEVEAEIETINNEEIETITIEDIEQLSGE